MSFNQKQFKTALPQVREQLSLQGKLPTIPLESQFSILRNRVSCEEDKEIAAFSPKKPGFLTDAIDIFDTLPSTNQTLWELLHQGATIPRVVIAAQQTAGRGQWGRQWQSGLGGLYLSVALAPHIKASNSAHLTLCSAWGIARALRSYGIPVFLKWPNDLLLLGLKLGGILTETRVQRGQITKAVIGVGINWSNAVPESGINLQSYGQQQLNLQITSLEMLAAIVLQGLLSGYQYWLEFGIESLLPSYLELLDSLGSQVMGLSGTCGGNSGISNSFLKKIFLSSLSCKEYSK